MIKTRINNEYKDVVKIFGGGTLQKEIIKVWSGEAHEYVYESSVEYTGTLPITINANGNSLLDYRIYGNTVQNGTPTPENPIMPEVVGERTENLWNGTRLVLNKYLDISGNEVTNYSWDITDYITITNGDYILSNIRGGVPAACFYDADKSFISAIKYLASTIKNVILTAPPGATFVRLSVPKTESYQQAKYIMLTEGSTAPTSYIPYGYKLPMTVSDGNTVQNVPVYIGEKQLMESEYVSYGEQKIYKRTENLFDISSLYSTIIVQGQTFTKPRSSYFFDVFSGSVGGSTPINLQKSIPVTSGTYTISFEESETKIAVVFSDGDTQTIIASSSSVTQRNFDVPSDGYISIRCENSAICSVKKLQIVKGSTAPSTYIPYLQPTDPPVPLPEIPTMDGTTVIDYDGDPKPSQMYIKYRR